MDLGFQDPLPPSLEGYLFPDTYHFVKRASTREIIWAMYDNFKRNFNGSIAEEARRQGFTRHQFVTLASIVEKETGSPSDRALISSVFRNRLAKKMRLESDPTTIYGMWERYTGNIRRSDLREMTPYNTYMVSGLPLGPIANPGRAAFKATLHPAQTRYLFFVSRNDGTTHFSETFREHGKAVQQYQKTPRERAGKSWRDLHKNSEKKAPPK